MEPQAVSASELIDRYRAVLRFSRDIAGHVTVEDLVRNLWTHLRGVVGFDRVALALPDEARQVMRVVAIRPAPEEPLPVTEIPFGETLAAATVWNTQETCIKHLDQAEPPNDLLRHFRDRGLRTLCYSPVTTPRARLGILIAGSDRVVDYSPESLRLLEHIADQIAIALEATQQVERFATLGAALAAERDRVQLLLRLTNEVATKLALPDLLNAISYLLRAVIPHHFASVTLWDAGAGQLRRHALVFPTGRGLIQDNALVVRGAPSDLAYRRGETVHLRWADIVGLGGEPARVMEIEGLRSVCSVPLRTPRGIHGTLNVASPDHEGFEPDEISLVEQVAAQLALAVENARHFEQAERFRQDAAGQRDRLSLLLRVNNAVVSERDPRALRHSVLETIRGALGHDYASLAVVSRDRQHMHIEAMTYYDGRGIQEPAFVVPIHDSPSGAAVLRGSPIVFTRDEIAAFRAEGLKSVLATDLQTFCCVPLVTPRGICGTISVGYFRAARMTDDELALLRDVAGQIAIAVENTLAFQEISSLKDQLAEEKLYLESEVTARHDFTEIVGESRALLDVLDQVRTVGPTDSTVLLLGETGTGKELLARAVHHLSPRGERTLVRVNGAALPTGLVESELFGYEKGAFTGAAATKIGRLELANRGTLFLDEIGDLPLEVQPKLLRALQEHEFERLGSTSVRHVDVRLIAATNRDLAAMVGAGTFRNDLYYRLNVFPIRVPPLRERPDDIPRLVHHFVGKLAREMGRHVDAVPAATMRALQQWHWPGNIRELANVIERAVILSPGKVLNIPPTAFGGAASPPVATALAASGTTLRDRERETILRALRDANGVVAGPDGAAARLGVKRTTLQSKMRKLGIERQPF